MALKLEKKCTRCHRATSTEVLNVAAAAESEELDTKRAVALKEIHDFIAEFDPELLPDLYVIRRGDDPIIQTYLCAEADAKRSCADRVAFITEECRSFGPRKPKASTAKGAADKKTESDHYND